MKRKFFFCYDAQGKTVTAGGSINIWSAAALPQINQPKAIIKPTDLRIGEDIRVDLGNAGQQELTYLGKAKKKIPRQILSAGKLPIHVFINNYQDRLYIIF